MAVARSAEELLLHLERRLALAHREAYSIAETAEVLGLGQTTVYELVRQGKIPAFRNGLRPGSNRCRVLIPREALRQWLRDNAERGAFVEI